jgi:signal transduction histidine kinase
LAELRNLITEYSDSISDPDVSTSDHDEIVRDMQRAWELASGSAGRAADYVRGIKTQTRDLSPSERRAFNAVPYIEEALLLLSHVLRHRHCTASFHPSADSVPIVGSPGRLAQIVTNLVTNAIDASADGGGGQVTIQLTRESDRVLLKVADRGSGIAPEVIDQIFEPMFTTKPFGQGTGLGLAIVRDSVIRDFGGEIWVSSTVGEGAEFTISFPLPPSS